MGGFSGFDCKEVMGITIFYASTTGKAADVDERLADLLAGQVTVKDVDSITAADDLAECTTMVCCVPTWNTGADTLRSGTAWDSYVEDIPDLDMRGCSVAILGLGDSSSYADYFCDAMEELHTAFSQAGARMVGHVSTDGYNFNASKSVVNGNFCGLAIDEDSEPELTDARLQAWVAQLKREMALG